MTWKQLTERDCREWKRELSTLMIDTSGDLVLDLMSSERLPILLKIAFQREVISFNFWEQRRFLLS